MGPAAATRVPGAAVRTVGLVVLLAAAAGTGGTISPSPNATAAQLQALINRDGDVLVASRRGPQPEWLVGLPLLFTRSHQRVTFAPGTVIFAANDSFHGKSDRLFTIGNYSNRLAPGVPAPPTLTNLSIVGYGAVWRMRRKDYAKTPSDKSNGWYSISEFRAGLVIQGSSDVSIEGISIQETGGDGIDVRSAWNVTLRRVLISGAYRNGISVNIVSGLLVEHSIIRDTRGTDPEAGLDIEPNACIPGRCEHVNFVHDVRFSNVSFIDNFGGGIHVSMGQINSTMPIGVRFDDCRVNGTGFSGPLQAEGRRRRLSGTGGAEPNAVVVGGATAPYHNTGEVRFNNLHVANASGGVGLILTSIPAHGWAQVIVDGLHLEAVGFDTNDPVWGSPISIAGSNPNAPPVQPGEIGAAPTGSIKIVNAVIHDRSARPYLRIVDPSGFRGVEVNATVINPYGCTAEAEAGFPLQHRRLSSIPPSNLSVHVICDKSPTVNGPSPPEEAQRVRKGLAPQQKRSAYPKRGLSGLSGCDDAAALNLKGGWEYNWDLWPVCVDADGGRTPEGSQPCTTPRAAEFVRECNILWSDFATAV